MSSIIIWKWSMEYVFMNLVMYQSAHYCIGSGVLPLKAAGAVTLILSSLAMTLEGELSLSPSIFSPAASRTSTGILWMLSEGCIDIIKTCFITIFTDGLFSNQHYQICMCECLFFRHVYLESYDSIIGNTALNVLSYMVDYNGHNGHQCKVGYNT